MMENTELPEFLRFGKYGHVLSPEERRRVAEARGCCITCGRPTHKVTAFRSKPLDNAHVSNGVCTVCNPEERKSLKSAVNTVVAVSALSRGGGILKKKSSKKKKPWNTIRSVGSSLSTSVEDEMMSARQSIEEEEFIKPEPPPPPDDAWDIMKSMRNNPEDVKLLTEKCHELCSLRSIHATGALYEIIEILHRHPDEKDLQYAGIGALWSIVVDGGDDVKIEAMDAEIVEVVSTAVKACNDEDITAWGMATLCSLAEGVGVRTRLLEEEGIVKCVNDALEQFLKNEKFYVDVLYWTLRCLLSLLATYREHEDFLEEGDFETDCELLEDLEAVDDVREVILKGKIAENVLEAIQKTEEMDGMTLQVGLEFLACLYSSNTPMEEPDIKGEQQFVSVFKQAIEIEESKLFPTIKFLACTGLGFLMSHGSVDNLWMIEPMGWAEDFRVAAVDVLRVKHIKNAVQRDVMMCLLSHLFYCGLMDDFPRANSILRFCAAAMAKEPTSTFTQETCLWILWGILAISNNTNPSKTLVNEVLEASTEAMSQIEDCANIIMLKTAIISNFPNWHDKHKLEAAVAAIYDIKSKHEENQIISTETNRFLVNACTTKKIASLIESKSLQTAALTITGKNDIELRYKVTILTKNIQFSTDYLKDAINIWQQSDRDVHLAAKILFILDKKTSCFIRTSHERNLLVEFVALTIEFINDLLQNTNNKEVHGYACMVLCHIPLLSEQSRILDSLDLTTTMSAIVDANNNGEKQLHAFWVLIAHKGVPPSLLNRLAGFLIDAISEHNSAQKELVSAAMAVLSIVLSKSSPVLQTLERKTVERAIRVVIIVMYECLDQADGDNSTNLLYALRCLRFCSQDSSLHDCILKEGGIVAVVDGMNVKYDNSQIQEEGCSIIQNLCDHSIETKMLIIEADGVDVILNMLITYSTNDKLLSEAFDILCLLAISKQLRVFIVSQGGLILTTSAMSSLGNNSFLQEKALKTLANLVSDIDDDVIEVADIPAAVNTSMFNHLSEINIQRIGVSILNNLSKRNATIQGQLLASNCLDTVFTALTIHMTRPKLMYYSLSVFLNLSHTEKCQSTLDDPDMLKLICHAMMVNLSCLKTQMTGLKLLCAMSSSVEISTETTFVETVVYAMMHHYSSEKIQYLGSKFLSCCSYHFRHIPDTSDLGSMMVEAVISGMEHFPSREQVQEQSIVALGSFLPHKALLKAIQSRAERVVETVHHAMTLSDSMETFEAGSDIVRVCKLERASELS